METDDFERALCTDCTTRPEARGLVPRKAAAGGEAALTVAERDLVTHLASRLPAAAVLRLVNERRAAARPVVPPATVEQLRDVVPVGTKATPRVDAGDWTSVRRRLADARRAGLLDRITPQVIDDFAIVFRLSAGQVTHLRDLLSHAKGARA